MNAFLQQEDNRSPFPDAPVTDPPQTKIQKTMKKILIVNDDPINNLILSKWFKDKTCEVSVVTDGLQALDVLKAQPDFDYILLDMYMPLMDGFTLMKTIDADAELKAQKFEIIIISGGLVADIRRSLKDQNISTAKLKDYLPKPIDFDDLEAMVL